MELGSYFLFLQELIKDIIILVRLPLMMMLLTSHPLSLILTLTLVRPEFSFLLCFLWEVYRDCFHVFSLLVIRRAVEMVNLDS